MPGNDHKQWYHLPSAKSNVKWRRKTVANRPVSGNFVCARRGASVSHPAKVLVVDDDPAVRRIVTELLRKAGHIARAANNGDDGLAALHSQDFDVVLVDLCMPGMGGLDLLDALPDTGTAAVPVVLTGHGDVPHAVEAMKRGAFDFLSKPIDSQTLRLVVERAREHGQQRHYQRVQDRLMALWRETLDACPDLIAVLDNDGRLLHANHALADRLGRRPEELFGLDASLLPGGIGSADRWVAPERDSAETEEVADSRFAGQFQVTTTPLCTAPGLRAGVVYVAHDVAACQAKAPAPGGNAEDRRWQTL